jgi:hypothetical protein
VVGKPTTTHGVWDAESRETVMKTITIQYTDRGPIEAVAKVGGKVVKQVDIRDLCDLEQFILDMKPQSELNTLNGMWEVLLDERLGRLMVEWASEQLARKGYDCSEIGNF